jgi:cell division protease FtsH
MTFLQAGADLANMVNEAGLFAIREGRVEITHSDLVRAIQRVSFGMSRSQHISVKELFETAYHEAGHTIVLLLPQQKGTHSSSDNCPYRSGSWLYVVRGKRRPFCFRSEQARLPRRY